MSLQKDVHSTIEAQVKLLLEQARRDTEANVKTELRNIYESITSMDQRLDDVLQQVDLVERQDHVATPLNPDSIKNRLASVEEEWSQEVKTLKNELHQTILAHNHNADLIKQHQDTIDQLQGRCDKLRGGRTPETQARLQRLDERIKHGPKSLKLQALFDRLEVLENRVKTFYATWGGFSRAMPHMGPPGKGMGPPGIGLMPPGAGNGLMPPGAGNDLTAALGSKGSSKPGGATIQPKAAQRLPYRTPTDEEVQRQLGKLSLSDAAGPPGLPTSAAAPAATGSTKGGVSTPASAADDAGVEVSAATTE